MKNAKSTRHRILLMSLAVALFGLLLSLLTFNVVQVNLQKFKYGEERKICFGKLGIEISDSWEIFVIDTKDSSTPILFGLFPIPRSLTSLNQPSTSLLLTEIKSEKNVAIFPDVELGDVRKAVENCKSSPYCSIGDVFVGGKNFTSLIVNSGKENVFTLIDLRATMISELSRFDGVFLRTCAVE